MATELTAADFETTISEGIVFLDFWASWCGPCRSFAPVFEAVSKANPDITFAKIDTEAEQALAQQLSIMSIPTLMVFRDGILLYNRPGALPADALADLVSQVRALDMDVVRAEVAASSTS